MKQLPISLYEYYSTPWTEVRIPDNKRVKYLMDVGYKVDETSSLSSFNKGGREITNCYSFRNLKWVDINRLIDKLIESCKQLGIERAVAATEPMMTFGWMIPAYWRRRTVEEEKVNSMSRKLGLKIHKEHKYPIYLENSEDMALFIRLIISQIKLVQSKPRDIHIFVYDIPVVFNLSHHIDIIVSSNIPETVRQTRNVMKRNGLLVSDIRAIEPISDGEFRQMISKATGVEPQALKKIQHGVYKAPLLKKLDRSKRIKLRKLDIMKLKK